MAKKIKDLTPKGIKLKTAEQEFQSEYQAGELPFGQSVGGLQAYSSSLKRGYGDAVFGSDDNGIWLGAADWGDAPFRVNMDGDVVASSADFSGAGYTKLTIFKQASIPTSVSVGDLWFDTDDNNALYRAGAVGADEITAGEWELVSSVGLTVFAQDGIPTSFAEGDLWYDTNDDNKVYRAASADADQITAGEWEAVDDQRAADALLKSGASQTLTGDILVGGANVQIDGANGRIIIKKDSLVRGFFGNT